MSVRDDNNINRDLNYFQSVARYGLHQNCKTSRFWTHSFLKYSIALRVSSMSTLYFHRHGNIRGKEIGTIYL